MASPPSKTLPSRSNSGSSSMSCCDAGLLYSRGSGGFGHVEVCGGNPFGDARQLERWAPIQPLTADATRDQAEPPAGLWNTDRDTSVADALLRHILLFGEGHGKSIRSFAQMAPRRRGDTLNYAAPSLAPLKLSDGGGGGDGATARASGSSSAAAFRMSPQSSVVTTAPGTPGHTARSKTLPHGLERRLLFGRTTRRTSAPGSASVPLRVSEHASRQV